MSRKTKHLFPYKWYIKDGFPSKGINMHGINKERTPLNK